MAANDLAGGLRTRPCHPRRRTVAPPAVVLVGLALLTGCVTDGPAQEAANTASAFVTALTEDPSAACDVLAPRTRAALEDDAGTDCPTALLGADLPDPGLRQETTLAGHSAQVRFAGDTVFLALFDDGWKIVAVGCDRASADLAVPYDCELEGS